MWLWETGIQTNQYLYKYLVESNREFYWVLSEQLPWLSSKFLWLHANIWVHSPEKSSRGDNLDQTHCLRMREARVGVEAIGGESTGTKGIFCVTRDGVRYTTSCTSYWSWVVRVKSMLLILFLELFWHSVSFIRWCYK